MREAGSSGPGAPSPRERAEGVLWTLAGIVLLLSLLVGVLGGSASADRVRPILAPVPLDGASAERIARRIASAHADVTAIWRHELRWRHGRSYAPPEVVTFAGRRFGPCAGPAGITGLSYCPADRTLSIDLAFMGGLIERLGAEGERALVLLVARGVSAHLQAELAILGDAERLGPGLAPEARASLEREVVLQADCLTGVWARRAARYLGPLPEGAWAAIVAGLREAAPEAAIAARLDLGAVEDREAAFLRGYEPGAVGACLVAGLGGVL